jgi:hypothetical protein
VHPTGLAQSKSQNPMMLEKLTVNPTGLAQSQSQNPLDSVTSREQDVVKENKNGVREKAKALAKLDKAKEESKWTAQNKSQPPAMGSENGFKQKSQALSPMTLEKPIVNPTGMAQSKSHNPLGSMASREQDVVEENKNGVREKAKALAKLDKAKEESKWTAQNKSQPGTGSATGVRMKPPQGPSMMLGKSKEHSNPMAQNKWLATTSEASEKQDVVTGNKNGVRERAKALAMREEAEEFARLNDSSRSLRL